MMEGRPNLGGSTLKKKKVTTCASRVRKIQRNSCGRPWRGEEEGKGMQRGKKRTRKRKIRKRRGLSLHDHGTWG